MEQPVTTGLFTMQTWTQDRIQARSTHSAAIL